MGCEVARICENSNEEFIGNSFIVIIHETYPRHGQADRQTNGARG